MEELLKKGEEKMKETIQHKDAVVLERNNSLLYVDGQKRTNNYGQEYVITDWVKTYQGQRLRA